MNPAYKGLLQKRIEGLSENDFDLEVWKSGTTLLLNRVFGNDNAYSNEIDKLKIDYSSWSLRDATSDYNPREACKRSGKDILELAIAEIGVMESSDRSLEVIKSTLQDKSGKLATAITSKDEKGIFDLLKKESKEDLAQLLTKLFTE
jgi:hypothetical protein